MLVIQVIWHEAIYGVHDVSRNHFVIDFGTMAKGEIYAEECFRRFNGGKVIMIEDARNGSAKWQIVRRALDLPKDVFRLPMSRYNSLTDRGKIVGGWNRNVKWHLSDTRE